VIAAGGRAAAAAAEQLAGLSRRLARIEARLAALLATGEENAP